MKCADCEKKHIKDLFDDGQELVYVCEVDNHYIGYTEDLDIECEVNCKYKINQEVYVNSTYSVGELCVVRDYGRSVNGQIVYNLHSVENGINGGSFKSVESNIFETKKDAINAYKEKSKEITEKFKNEIKDLQDLLNFPLKHCFCGEEYTEYEAIAAYKARAAELTGIQLDK